MKAVLIKGKLFETTAMKYAIIWNGCIQDQSKIMSTLVPVIGTLMIYVGISLIFTVIFYHSLAL